MNREFSTFVLRTLRTNKDRYYGTDNVHVTVRSLVEKMVLVFKWPAGGRICAI